MSCAPIDLQGDTACQYAQLGQACGGTLECAAPYACVDGGCGVFFGTNPCVPSSTSCALGDDCSYWANHTGSGPDPCFSSGFVCGTVTNTAGTAYIGTCIAPSVVDPADGFPFSYWPCNSAANQCAPADYSSQTTSSTCAHSWYVDEVRSALQGLAATPICLASCQTSADCSSLTENCVNGACVQVYCFADSAQDATFFTQLQGSPAVSSDSSVLFQPCSPIGGADSYCLPQYDQLLGVASGLCYRVGAVDAGGLGAACNPNMYGSDPSGLCAPGFLCDQGTCLQWCDVFDKYVSPCTGSDSCLVNHNIALSINRTVARGIGVCAQQCDPYNPPTASGNGCGPVDGSATCTPQAPVCKLTGEDTNLSPAPGLCLNGIATPLAVGSLCNPVADWADPCVSSAICAASATGGSYVCTQLCDLHPSGGAASSCQAPTTCQALACQNSNGTAVCTHKGICQ
jgi:hypothetical protein